MEKMYPWAMSLDHYARIMIRVPLKTNSNGQFILDKAHQTFSRIESDLRSAFLRLYQEMSFKRLPESKFLSHCMNKLIKFPKGHDAHQYTLANGTLILLYRTDSSFDPESMIRELHAQEIENAYRKGEIEDVTSHQKTHPDLLKRLGFDLPDPPNELEGMGQFKNSAPQPNESGSDDLFEDAFGDDAIFSPGSKQSQPSALEGANPVDEIGKEDGVLFAEDEPVRHIATPPEPSKIVRTLKAGLDGVGKLIGRNDEKVKSRSAGFNARFMEKIGESQRRLEQQKAGQSPAERKSQEKVAVHSENRLIEQPVRQRSKNPDVLTLEQKQSLLERGAKVKPQDIDQHLKSHNERDVKKHLDSSSEGFSFDGVSPELSYEAPSRTDFVNGNLEHSSPDYWSDDESTIETHTYQENWKSAEGISSVNVFEEKPEELDDVFHVAEDSIPAIGEEPVDSNPIGADVGGWEDVSNAIPSSAGFPVEDFDTSVFQSPFMGDAAQPEPSFEKETQEQPPSPLSENSISEAGQEDSPFGFSADFSAFVPQPAFENPSQNSEVAFDSATGAHQDTPSFDLGVSQDNPFGDGSSFELPSFGLTQEPPEPARPEIVKNESPAVNETSDLPAPSFDFDFGQSAQENTQNSTPAPSDVEIGGFKVESSRDSEIKSNDDFGMGTFFGGSRFTPEPSKASGAEMTNGAPPVHDFLKKAVRPAIPKFGQVQQNPEVPAQESEEEKKNKEAFAEKLKSLASGGSKSSPFATPVGSQPSPFSFGSGPSFASRPFPETKKEPSPSEVKPMAVSDIPPYEEDASSYSSYDEDDIPPIEDH